MNEAIIFRKHSIFLYRLTVRMLLIVVYWFVGPKNLFEILHNIVICSFANSIIPTFYHQLKIQTESILSLTDLAVIIFPFFFCFCLYFCVSFPSVLLISWPTSFLRQ